jgi:hypothetical protein
LRRRKLDLSGEKCIKMSCRICVLHQVLCGDSRLG